MHAAATHSKDHSSSPSPPPCPQSDRLLGYFAVAFVLRTRHRRSAVLFHATTPTGLSPNLRLQAVANMAHPAGYAVLLLAFALPVVLPAQPSPLSAARYLAADLSMLARIVSHLALAPIVSGLPGRVRLAWAAAVIFLLAAEIGACAVWPPANAVVLAVNAALLAASWSNGVRAWNPVTLYRAMIRRLARSQRQPLVARRLLVERSVYAGTFLLTPYGVLSCLAAYGFSWWPAAPTCRRTACRWRCRRRSCWRIWLRRRRLPCF